MEPDRTLEKAEGLLAVVRGESRSAALEVVGALIEGGVLGIEITFTTPKPRRSYGTGTKSTETTSCSAPAL
jgi:2-keto-3-deoxy-6-phosphogluconate aldolase